MYLFAYFMIAFFTWLEIFDRNVAEAEIDVGLRRRAVVLARGAAAHLAGGLQPDGDVLLSEAGRRQVEVNFVKPRNVPLRAGPIDERADGYGVEPGEGAAVERVGDVPVERSDDRGGAQVAQCGREDHLHARAADALGREVEGHPFALVARRVPPDTVVTHGRSADALGIDQIVVVERAGDACHRCRRVEFVAHRREHAAFAQIGNNAAVRVLLDAGVGGHAGPCPAYERRVVAGAFFAREGDVGLLDRADLVGAHVALHAVARQFGV